MMSDSEEKTLTALCGRCLVPVVGQHPVGDDTVLSCPECGNGDTLRNITVEVADYRQHLISKQIGFPEPDRVFQFIAEDA